jgi:hypothetical protein
MWRRAATVAWWLGASAYFGGIVTIGIVVPSAIFATTKSAALSMPRIVSPPLDMSAQVGGAIFGAVLERFSYLEVISLAVMLLALVAMIAGHKTVRRSTWVLLGLWMILTAFAAYEAAYLRPQVLKAADEYRASAIAHVDAESAWPEKEAFTSLHTRDETFGRLKAYVLLGMIVTGAWKGLAEKSMHGGSK